MNSFDRNSCKIIRDDLQHVLDSYMSDDNLQASVGNATYSSTEITFKVKVTLKGAHEEKIEEELTRWMRLLKIENTLSPEGEILVAYNANRPKYPWTYKRPDGKLFKTTQQGAEIKFGKVESCR